MVITCRGTVETEDKAGVIGQHAGHLPLWAFLGQTDADPAGPADQRADRRGRAQRRAAWCRRCTTCRTRSASGCVYDTGAHRRRHHRRGRAWPPGTGVCQDHAHIFIAAARALEMPARYVSGYLMMNDRIEQEATHAWAEA